jgi:hypothetical protein
VLFGTPVPDQTIAYLCFDDQNIYVAFYAYDSRPQEVVARETKRGTRFNSDDRVGFSIDTSHTHKFADRSFFLITPSVTWRFGDKLTLGLASSIPRHTEDAEQQIFTFNYDFSPRPGIGGRVVSQTGGTNGYLSYRHSGYGSVETWLILGDPNGQKFRRRLVGKVVWPM